MAYVIACGGDRAEWETRWRQIAAELAAANRTETDGIADEDAPYMGLAAFQPADANRFFGWADLIEDLVDRVRK